MIRFVDMSLIVYRSVDIIIEISNKYFSNLLIFQILPFDIDLNLKKQ